jgi:translation initiation factor 1
MAKKKSRYEAEAAPQNNPFGGLGEVSFSAEEVTAYEKSKSEVPVPASTYSGGLVRVRLEKKGRGGKSVTVFYDFDKGQRGLLPDLLKDLKKHLASGGKVIDGTLELQGDQRPKAAEWLTSQGYKVKGQLVS